MNLASRCNECGTLFRVVRDQLWISDGWVRCGRCGCAFNALDHLYDLTQGKPPPWPSSTDDVASSESRSAGVEGAAEVAERAPDVPGAAGDLPESLAESAPASASVDETAEPEDDVRGSGFVEAAVDAPALEAPSPPLLPVEARDAFATTPATGAAWPTPEFVRRAERQARWRQPRMRLALGLLSLLLLGGLLLQSGLHFRDRLAARSPEAASALAWLCAKLDCTLETPRRIADVTVESSALTRVPGDGNLVRLSMTLRNAGRGAVAMPAVDLTLTDATGKMLVRRALLPIDLRATPVLAPDVDVPLQVLLATDGQRIAGYKLEIFYP